MFCTKFGILILQYFAESCSVRSGKIRSLPEHVAYRGKLWRMAEEGSDEILLFQIIKDQWRKATGLHQGQIVPLGKGFRLFMAHNLLNRSLMSSRLMRSCQSCPSA